MSQKGLAPILIIILIALAAGGYLIYQKQTKPVAVFQPLPSSVASPVVSDEIATWETYTSNKYRFSVKYPSSLVPQEIDTSIITFINPNDKSEIPNKLTIHVLDGTKVQTEEVSKYFTVQKGSSWENIRIGEFNGSYAGTTKNAQNGIVATLNTSGKFFIFQLTNREEQTFISNKTFFQILSTFKFTQ